MCLDPGIILVRSLHDTIRQFEQEAERRTRDSALISLWEMRETTRDAVTGRPLIPASRICEIMRARYRVRIPPAAISDRVKAARERIGNSEWRPLTRAMQFLEKEINANGAATTTS